ncbi:hypothetical protein [Candidatus Formimonas warabiya]|uniref:DUF2878 domain-containing protein n=1 Tax=Formimonas warabiya TaxID=1761012 RepID=A0A3G1KVC1_FORW1|nr:hypothetical protein [Candidatus Formimonas warabiya]ATW26155.1 hypothetical protein DCMF_16490 [Candidatus Formimonas warabiya]
MFIGLGKSVFFFYKALLFGLATVIVIPRNVYKRYLIYGFMFGAIGDLIVATIFGPLLHIIRYKNMGVFNIFGIVSFWTPIAWMFAFMLFFYFLPVRRIFLYPYIIGFSFFGYMVGIVLKQLGLFEYIGSYIYFAPLTFIVWFSIAAWIYLKDSSISLH